MKLLTKIISVVMLLFITTIVSAQHTSSMPTKGKLITQVFTSTILKDNLVGLDVKRNIKIYLPADYNTTTKSYPVVYFLHNFFWDNERMFEDGKITTLIDRAVAEGVIKEFIFVVPDFRTATTGSLYDNSPVNGRWLDHMTKEIIPFIDKNFRTIPRADARAITGEFMGGRGALRLAMTYPDLFSVVYALHPVATGTGELPWSYLRIDWKKLYASSYPDPSLDGLTQIFLSVFQTFLPNPNRPPLYCDFFMELVNGEPQLHPVNAQKVEAGFSLDEYLDKYADNLRKLKGIGFDWGRFDPNFAHIDSNREFSIKLENLGIEHEAEEYRGGTFDKTWLDDGRFYARTLPFLAKRLTFDNSNVTATK